MSTGGQPAFFSCWDIHAYYKESYIVQGVSFDIREGEIVALLGRNGAGKTSTLRAIARVDDPELKHGEIWLDHQPLHEMKAHQASRLGVGLVPLDHLDPTFRRSCFRVAARHSDTKSLECS